MAISDYIALVHKDAGASYGVGFPDVPGCISAGDTFEEAGRTRRLRSPPASR